MMRVTIVVTDDAGRTFEGSADLFEQEAAPAVSPTESAATPAANGLNLGLPRRAFLKNYARGGGPLRFATLLAHMTQGRPDVEVARESIEKEWERNKGVLGGTAFHQMHATRAQEYGWCASPRRGVFTLRPEWRKALEG